MVGGVVGRWVEVGRVPLNVIDGVLLSLSSILALIHFCSFSWMLNFNFFLLLHNITNIEWSCCRGLAPGCRWDRYRRSSSTSTPQASSYFNYSDETNNNNNNNRFQKKKKKKRRRISTSMVRNLRYSLGTITLCWFSPFFTCVDHSNAEYLPLSSSDNIESLSEDNYDDIPTNNDDESDKNQSDDQYLSSSKEDADNVEEPQTVTSDRSKQDSYHSENVKYFITSSGGGRLESSPPRSTPQTTYSGEFGYVVVADNSQQIVNTSPRDRSSTRD